VYIIKVHDGNIQKAREKMGNFGIFHGAVLRDDLIIAEFCSESKGGSPYLSVFRSDGECIHRCHAQNKPCWHLGVGTIASELIFGKKIDTWKKHLEWPNLAASGGMDITPLLAGRQSNFEKLRPEKVEAAPEGFTQKSQENLKAENMPESSAQESIKIPPEDRWIAGLNLPPRLFEAVIKFRERQKEHLWSSPESWKKIPNLGGDSPAETPFAEWMEPQDLEDVRVVEYIPQDRELVYALAPLLYNAGWSPPLLIGPKSSGKTTLAYYLARILCLPVTVISGSTDTNEEKLIGYHDLVPVEGGVKTRFVPGALLNPVIRGEMLIFNEINQALPDVISVMNDLLDWQKVVYVKGIGEIKPGENFRLVATMNPGYIGTAPLNQALEDRFRRVDVPYPPKEVVMKLLPYHDRELSELYSRIVQSVESGELDDDVVSIRNLIRCSEEIEILGGDRKKIIVSAICSGLQDRSARQIIADIVESMF